MPDDPRDRSRWLDEQLVGDRLGELVDEWAALGADRPPDKSLTDLLGEYRSSLLAGGTGALPHLIRQRLRQCPAYLLELQELVLLEGGPYWYSIPRPDRLIDIVERSRKEIIARFPAAESPEAIRPNRRQHVSAIARWAVPFAVAASVVAVLWGAGWWWPRSPAPSEPEVAWGWAKPGALPHAATSDEYYAVLAAGGEQWFNKRPDDRADLAKRLSELRRGCSVLIVSNHAPLSPEQTRDLKDRCKKWAGQFDAALVRLENGEDPITVRSDVDAVVTMLVAYLNSQRGA